MVTVWPCAAMVIVPASILRAMVAAARNVSATNGDATIVTKVAKTDAVLISASAANNTFTRQDAGSFILDGFAVGMRIGTVGMAQNASMYIVTGVSTDKITVKGGAGELKDEPTVSNARLVAFGKRGPILDNLFKWRDTVFAMAVDAGARQGADLTGLLNMIVTNGTPGFPDLKRAYLYNWVNEIDEGIRHWGEVGLAFSRGMFDAGSRRALQQLVGEATGLADSADSNSARSKAEDAVGIIDVILAQLDDPNGDGSKSDSFINKHLLPMFGIPEEFSLIRDKLNPGPLGLTGLIESALQGALGKVEGVIKDLLINPLNSTIDKIEGLAPLFLKGQLEERFGVDPDLFQLLFDLRNKMDLESIKIGSDTIPIFKAGDHERLDALLGLTGDHHLGDAPTPGLAGYVFELHPDAKLGLNDDAHFDKSTFAGYADALTLTKMSLLMEISPAGLDNVDVASQMQLSKLYRDNGAPAYDVAKLDLNGAHGGNVLTATLPNVTDVANGQIWLKTIDADQVWRSNNVTTTNARFRVSTKEGPAGFAVYEATGLTDGDEYEVYTTWAANVTQTFENQGNPNFPDQHISPTPSAQYTIISKTGTSTVSVDQRLFAGTSPPKEGCELTNQKESLAQIAYQTFFRRYLRLSGMTGTAREVAGEMRAVYGLRTYRIPTHRPGQRRNFGAVVHPTADAKWQAIAAAANQHAARGRPVLIGTRSVAASEIVASLLSEQRTQHVVLNARQDHVEADAVAAAGEPSRITVATNMAGRGTDIKLGQGVAEAGGLHVILTEYHESARIDRQLVGRAGRQGDPGSYEAITSIEDEVFQRFAPFLTRWVASRFGDGIPSGFTIVLRRLAQRTAERYNSRIRRQIVRRDQDLDRAFGFAGRPD